MTGRYLLALLNKAHRRAHVTGTTENGIISALDMEGRLFTVLKNKVLNRVVPSAIINRTNKLTYLNPGGDALWPAPEGTCFGYEYGTGKWRVPPAITGAVWDVVSQTDYQTIIRAEIDLVNNLQTGIPCEFERHIRVFHDTCSLTQQVKEVIRYIGKRTLHKGEFLLAPWSLCQFDSGKNGKVVLPPPPEEEIWDIYEPSNSQRSLYNDLYTVDTITPKRFQLGIGSQIPWIEFNSDNQLIVRRFTNDLPEDQHYIDISDVPPDQSPADKGVKLSIYCDPTGFTEIEACGGCTDILYPGTELIVNIITEYRINP